MNQSLDPIYYATFLVEVFPQVAIEIISDGTICNLEKVGMKFGHGCVTLGMNTHEIMTMVQKRQFDDLRALKAQSYISPSRPSSNTSLSDTQNYLNKQAAGGLPPSPTPTASTGKSQHLSTPTHEMIFLSHKANEFKMSMGVSGTDWSLIEENSLKRFEDIEPTWVSQYINYDHQYILVEYYVQLTWRRCMGGQKTHYSKFYVVPSGYIKDVDVLLGHKDQPFRQQPDNGVPESPLYVPLDKQSPRPHPQHSQHTSSISSNTCHSPPPSHVNQGLFPSPRPGFPGRLYQQPEPPAHPTQCSSSHNSSTPRPGPQSAQTTKHVNSNSVRGLLSFQGINSNISMKLELNASEEAILSSLGLATRRVSKGQRLLDRSIHMVEFKPLTGDNESETNLLPLSQSDFEDNWASTRAFILENRPGTSGKPEFSLVVQAAF